MIPNRNHPVVKLKITFYTYIVVQSFLRKGVIFRGKSVKCNTFY